MIRKEIFILKNPNRAAVLIMTMMAITLTFMMIYVLTQTSGFGLRSTASFYDREAALQAAQSGMDYAVTQLQANRSWKGDSNRDYWENGVSSWKKSGGTNKNYDGDEDKDVKIIESNGNVVGLITNKFGSKTAFRIKFNYELDSSDISAGKLNDVPCNTFAEIGETEPITQLPVNMPYVSVNNLGGSVEALMYRANPDGKGICGETDNLELSAQDSTTRMYANHVPPQRICLIVEGLAGNGLRDCKKPEDVLNAVNNGPVTRRYVEAYYTFNPPVFRGYGAFANGTLGGTVSDKMFVKSVGYQSAIYKVPAPGSICGGQAINFSNSVLNTYGGTAYSAGSITYKPDKTEYNFERFKGRNYRAFAKTIPLSFSNIPTEKISSANQATVDTSKLASAANKEKYTNGYILNAGLYQWHKVPGKSNKYELRYYTPPFTTVNGRPVPTPENKYNYKIMVAKAKDTGTVKVKNDANVEIEIKKEQLIAGAVNGKVDLNDDLPIINLHGQVYTNGPVAISTDIDEIGKVCPRINIGSYIDPKDKNNVENGVLISKGDLTLVSSVSGDGAIIARDDDTNTNFDIFMLGETALNQNNNSDGLAIYGNNITLGPLSVATTKPLTDDQLITSTDISDEAPIDATITLSADEFMSMFKNYKEYPIADADGVLYASDNDTAMASIAKWFKDKHNALIEVQDYKSWGAGERWSGFYFNYRFLNKNSTGYEDQYLDYDWHEVQIHDMLSDKIKLDADKVAIPAAAYLGSGDGARTSSPTPAASASPAEEFGMTVNANDYSERYNDITYGDQYINGLLCAKGSLNANLGSNKLIVQGAVRAESGSMTLNCGTVDITYDENCIAKLLPLYCNLTCELWNCW